MTPPANDQNADAKPDTAQRAAPPHHPEVLRLSNELGLEPGDLDILMQLAREAAANPKNPPPPDHPELLRIAKKRGLETSDTDLLMQAADDANSCVKSYDRREQTRREAKWVTTARLILVNQDPWPDPVETADLLRSLTAAIEAHVALPPGAPLLTALWAMHTHALDAFSLTPRLVISSRGPATGKTTLLSVLAHLTPRAIKICAASPQAITRYLPYRPTMLIDDAGNLMNAHRELRMFIRSGGNRLEGFFLNPRRGYSQSSKCELFGAAAIAAEGMPPRVAGGRSIHIPLRRAAPDIRLARLDHASIERLTQLHRMMVRWAQDRLPSLSAAEAAAPRTDDGYWTPLLLIAADAGPEWERQARAVMQIARAASASDLELLLGDIRALIGEYRENRLGLRSPDGKRLTDYDRMRSADLARLLANLDGQPWCESGKGGRPITPHGLAKLLAEAGVRPSQLWFQTCDQNGARHGFNDRGYMLAQLEDAIARYLPDAMQEAA